MRRVVVTGLGMVTPLGCGVEHTWQRLISGQSGVAHVERFDVSRVRVRVRKPEVQLDAPAAFTAATIERSRR